MKRFLICFVAGVVVSLLTIYVLYMIDTHGGEIVPFNQPSSFGDVVIWLAKAPKHRTNDAIHWVLYMAKDDIPFCEIYKDKADKTFELLIYNEKKRILFSMEAATEQGKWEYVTYAGQK